jgi:thiamine-monophosphate kinase
MNEVAIIEKLRKLAARGPRIALGIGDDCAIFRPRAGQDLLLRSTR